MAIAPNSPIIDLFEASMAFGGDFSKLLKLIKLIRVSILKSLSDMQMRKRPVLKAFKEYTDWTSGLYPTELTPAEKLEVYLNFLKPFTMKERLDQINCATIALVSVGDGEVLLGQAKELIAKISSKQKCLHLFTMEKDGSDDHCQLDNRSRGAQVMFDFFDDVFNYKSALQCVG